MKEKNIYDDILTKSTNIRDRFETFFKTKMKENGVSPNLIDDNVVNIIKTLLFGTGSSSKISKNDFHKQFNLIKQLFLKLPDIENTLSLLKDMIFQFDEYINYVSSTFSKLEVIKDKKITNDTFCKIRDMLNHYSWTSMHIRSDVMTLKTLIHNSGWIHINKSLTLIDKKDIGNAKPDTLKRYYFDDVYDLKNSIKLFNNNEMIFGETNTIMNLYNKIFEYIFKHFICVYNIIYTNIEWLHMTK